MNKGFHETETGQKQKHKKDTDNLLIISVFCWFWGTTFPFSVEPAGVEPASKLAAKVLSTRLVTVWLSAMSRYGTDQLTAYLLKFRSYSEAYTRYPSLYDTSCQPPDGEAAGEAPDADDLVNASGIAAVKRRMHSCCHLLAKRVSF